MGGAPGDAGTDDGPVNEVTELGVFTSVPLPIGGEAWMIATTAANPQRLYAIVNGRVFRSSDSALSWTECGKYLPSISIVASPTDQDIVYVGGLDGVFGSTDACATWQRLTQTTYEVTRLALQGDDLLAAAEDLVRIDASGLIETLIPNLDEHIDALVVRGDQIVACSWADGVLVSDDGGDSFVSGNTGLATPRCEALAFVGPDDRLLITQTENGTYRSTNGGMSWTSSGFPEGRATVAVSSFDPDLVVNATWHGVGRSLDGGVSFSASNFRTPVFDNARTIDLAFETGAGERVFAATTGGIFSASDRNLDWQRRSNGISAHRFARFSVVRGTGTILSVGGGGVWISHDHGETWDLSVTGFESDNADMAVVATSPASPGTVWVGGSSFMWWSDNGGDSFNKSIRLDQTDGWGPTAIHWDSPTIWMGTHTRMWRSDNDGADWVPVALGTTSAEVTEISYKDGELWVATSDGVWRSDDRGGSYDRIADGEFGAVELLSSTEVLAGDTEGVFLINADGVTRLGLEARWVTDILADQGVWYVASLDGVFRSSDRGATWQYMGLAHSWPIELEIDEQNRLIVGTDGYGLFRVAL